MIRQKKIARYIQTIRYLQFRQVLFRFYYAFRSMRLKSVQTQQLRNWTQTWKWPSFFTSCYSEKKEITIFGETGVLNDAVIWNDPTRSKLWLYNLHYLNELNSLDADSRGEDLNKLIDQWISENLPCKGNGWEPYPLSLRIVNLVKWYLKHSELVKPERVASLCVQAEALVKQVEYHILGNHLFANGKAFVFLGVYFDGSSANRWLKKGLKILDREVDEQFLADGAHFELSPMYHACLLWDLCDLVNLANQAGLPELILRKQKWQIIIERGLNWLFAMLHPDGGISFFNDTAFGIAPDFSDIKNYAAQLGITVPAKMNDFSLQWLKESGYCVVNLGAGNKAILDIAKIGPDYQPGHAHADTLSFELSLDKQRFLVNSGTSCYDDGILRQHQRGTKAHNTVCVNGVDSSEIWAGFRVARRAYPKKIVICKETDRFTIGCSHNGYLRLPGQPVHRRQWRFTRNSLIIHDAIAGNFDEAEVMFYFHPDIRICGVQKNTVKCYLAMGQKVTINVSDTASLDVQSSYWYPSFNTGIANQCLIVKLKGNELLTEIKW